MGRRSTSCAARQRYLSPTRHLTLVALAAAVLQHAVFSVVVYGGLLVAGFFALDVADQGLRPVRALAAFAARGPWKRWALLNANVALVVAAACALLLVAQAFWPGLRRLARWRRPWSAATVRAEYLRRRRSVRRGGTLLQIGVVALVIGTVPPVSHAFGELVGEATARGVVLAAVVALLAAAFGWSRRLEAAGVRRASSCADSPSRCSTACCCSPTRRDRPRRWDRRRG